MISASRAGLTASAIALAAILTACAEPPAPKSAPPPPPPIALAPKLIEQASAYRYYMDRASKITPAFASSALNVVPTETESKTASTAT